MGPVGRGFASTSLILRLAEAIGQGVLADRGKVAFRGVSGGLVLQLVHPGEYMPREGCQDANMIVLISLQQNDE